MRWPEVDPVAYAIADALERGGHLPTLTDAELDAVLVNLFARERPGPTAAAQILHALWGGNTTRCGVLAIDFGEYTWFSILNEALAGEPFRFFRIEDDEIYAYVLRGPRVAELTGSDYDVNRGRDVPEQDDANLFYREVDDDDRGDELARIEARLDAAGAARLADITEPAHAGCSLDSSYGLDELIRYADAELVACGSERRIYALGHTEGYGYLYLVTTPPIAEALRAAGCTVEDAGGDTPLIARPVGDAAMLADAWGLRSRARQGDDTIEERVTVGDRTLVLDPQPLPGHVLDVEGRLVGGALHVTYGRDAGYLAPRWNGRYRVGGYASPPLLAVSLPGFACVLEAVEGGELAIATAREVLRLLFGIVATPADDPRLDRTRRDAGGPVPDDREAVPGFVAATLKRLLPTGAMLVGQLAALDAGGAWVLGAGDACAYRIGKTVELVVPDQSMARAMGVPICGAPRGSTSAFGGDVDVFDTRRIELGRGDRLALVCGCVAYQQSQATIEAALRMPLPDAVGALERPTMVEHTYAVIAIETFD